MIATNQDEYRRAFAEYLRKGTPIRLQAKQTATSGQYVWRTQDDGKVRPSHRANDGRVFDWSTPPNTGHPGTDHGCKCRAVPYVSGATEFAFHVKQDFPPVRTHRYGDHDFVAHYYFGSGRDLTLAEIGHLREIAEHYAYATGTEGALRRLSNQIADEARNVRFGSFIYEFEDSYDFGAVDFSHGGGTVNGVFLGTVRSLDGLLKIEGDGRFQFKDRFEDPLGIGLEPGGNPYGISGEWTAAFSAEVFADATASEFTKP